MFSKYLRLRNQPLRNQLQPFQKSFRHTCHCSLKEANANGAKTANGVANFSLEMFEFFNLRGEKRRKKSSPSGLAVTQKVAWVIS